MSTATGWSSFWRKAWVQQAVNTLLAIVVISALLLVVGLTTARVGVFEEKLQKWANTWQDDKNQVTPNVAPMWLVSLENSMPVVAYITWAAMAALIVYLIFLAPNTIRKLLVENWRLYDFLIGGLVFGGVLSGVTGYLWASFNPVLILPPYVHLRIFSFLIAVWAIWIGRGTGAITGYFGGIVWGLMSGAFLAPHTLVSDGFWVGIATGWFISVAIRRGKSREELLKEISANRWRYYLRCAGVSLLGGLIMSFFVSVSMKILSPYSWWSSFLAIGLISDTLPMVIWTGITSEVILRVTRRLTWIGNF